LQNTVRKFYPFYVEVRREFTELAAYKKMMLAASLKIKKQLVKSNTSRWFA